MNAATEAEYEATYWRRWNESLRFSIRRQRRRLSICLVIALHPLKGDLKGFWSVTVRANWRIVFRFEGEDAFDVELTDYH
jgi:plasmid maintenance system killer protein